MALNRFDCGSGARLSTQAAKPARARPKTIEAYRWAGLRQNSHTSQTAANRHRAAFCALLPVKNAAARTSAPRWPQLGSSVVTTASAAATKAYTPIIAEDSPKKLLK